MTQPRPASAAAPGLSLVAFALAFVAAAAFAISSRYPGYVHHDTAEIAMWSTLGWPAGLPKHPPLLPWIFRAYSYLVPLNWLTLSVLTAANIVAGAWAVWQIARLVLDERRAVVAMLLYGLAPAGTFLALKLNHNAILVSLWPLIILAFLKCLDATTAKSGLLWGAAFGAAAAAGMLAKYYTGVLLVSCIAALLASDEAIAFLKRPAGYAALAVFALLMTPHVMWMLHDSGGETLDYALQETSKAEHLTGHFLVVTPLYLLPPLIGFGLLGRSSGFEAAPSAHCRRWRELVTLTSVPFLLTAALIAAFKLRGATSWTLPDFCVFPILLAASLGRPSLDMLERLKRMAAWVLAAVALLGPIWLIVSFRAGDANMVEPRAEVALRAGEIFERVTGRPPALVAGDPQSATSAFLALPSHPQVFTMFSYALAPWVTPERLDREGLLSICRTPGYCEDHVQSVMAGRIMLTCRVTAKRHLFWLEGKPMTAHVGIILPKGMALSEYMATTGCLAGEGAYHAP